MADNTKTGIVDGDGRYMVVNMIARRAREINKLRTNQRMYSEEEVPDPLDVASNEYKNDLLEFEFRHHLVGTGDDYRSV